MPEIDEITLKKQLKEGQFLPVYFLYGEETYLTAYYAQQLVQKVLGAKGNDFNYTRFAGKGLAIDQLADAVEQLPLMSTYKCVEVNDLDADALVTTEWNKLQELLEDLPASCVLVLWYSSVIPSLKSAKWKKLLDLCRQHGAVLQCTHKDTASLARLLCDGAGKRGCRMHTSTARYLIETCGNEMQSLLRELDKLCAFRPGEEISRADIDRLCVKTLDSTSFDLMRAINRGQTEQAFALLDELFAQKLEPLMILGALSSSYIDMYRAKCAVTYQISPRELATDLGYRNKERLRYASSDASRFDMEQLRRCLFILLDTDAKLKSLRTDKRTLLEQTILRLFQAAKEPIR